MNYSELKKLCDSRRVQVSDICCRIDHTGAISMVENGASVWELQAHMRHSSITTTEEYIRQRAPQSRRAKDYIDDI